jgi:ribose transport system substrate-binding protein
VRASIAAALAIAQSFDDPKEFARQRELMKMPPQGPAGKPWEQYVGGQMIDTSKYKKPGHRRLQSRT